MYLPQEFGLECVIIHIDTGYRICNCKDKTLWINNGYDSLLPEVNITGLLRFFSNFSRPTTNFPLHSEVDLSRELVMWVRVSRSRL